MSERTTGVLIGGIIALIGALSGLGIGILLPSMVFLAGITNPALAMYAIIVLILSIIALILSILIIAGKYIKWSTIIVLIIGIISLVGFMGGALGVIPGIIEIIGAIIAMATGALK
ncbi:MAG: hypothetical protein QW261_10300 [Candidatus Jordarchaeaceae archaeon]